MIGRTFAGIGGDAVANLVREFILKRFTSHVPKGATKNHRIGKPGIVEPLN